MKGSTRTGVAVLMLFGALTVAMTWPQARYLSTHVADSDDPLLSIWRIAWIAHALPAAPADVMNGNIFYPEKRTLAYTDSVLLQGLAAAPLIWAGVKPVAAYNLLMLGSIALSGAAMWLLACRLTGSATAAVLAGIVFAFVPFRFDHYPHLELQATMFMPLALWFLVRAFETGNRRDVWGAIASVTAQVFCGIYYAIFLVTALVVAIPIGLAGVPADRRRALARAAWPAALVAAMVVAPYFAAYAMNRSTLGERSDSDVAIYSATPANYLASNEDSLIYGSSTARLGRTERRLFPGAIAVVLAGIGLLGAGRRRWALASVGLVGVFISLGLNNPLYEPLRQIVFVYRGLRAPARASILVYLAIAALAAYGWARLERRHARAASLGTLVVAAAMLLEYVTVMKAWYVVPPPPQVYRWLAGQPRSVVVEFPIAPSDRLHVAADGLYMMGSIEHWHPILNGYSGFYPRSFFELTEVAKTFPSDQSIEYLKTRGVDILVVHGGMMAPDRFGAVTAELLARPNLRAVARFDEPGGPDLVFRLSR